MECLSSQRGIMAEIRGGDETRMLPGRDLVRDLGEAEEILSDLDSGTSVRFDPSLHTAARQWSDRLAFDALRQVAHSITANLDLHSLVRQILDTALQSVGAERGILFLGEDPDPDRMPAVARSGAGKDLEAWEQFSRTVLRRVLHGETIQSDDALIDPALRDIPSVSLSSIRSVLCLPLLVRGRLRGALYIDNRTAPFAFSEASRRFLQAFADMAAVALDNAELHGEVLRENRRLRQRVDSRETFGRIVTISPNMTAVLRRACLVAQSDAPVMILGESGTGKELLARAIHEAGPRALHPLVAHNCAAVPGLLMESIFFGHVRGAFTGAVRNAPGLFRQAHRGVLFLDEVAELDLALQAKLLRVLEDGIIRPVGGDREYRVDVRLITATSRDLRRAVRDGDFREELYYRTNVLEINLPPLRERAVDIPVLVDSLLRKHSPGGEPRLRLTPDALEFLQTLPWRGNIRELDNLVQRALILCPTPSGGVEEIRRLVSEPLEVVAPGQSADRLFSPGQPAPDGMRGNQPGPLPTVHPLEEERREILDALRRARGNKSEVARLLGLHRNALLRRMKRLGIEM